MSACVTQTFLVEAVGPASAAALEVHGEGWLIVYSATHDYGDVGGPYRPHSSYHIYHTDMTNMKTVHNNTHERNERPVSVSLAAGSYIIRAVAEGIGSVAVPVLVQAGKTTEVHLQRGWKPTSPPDDDSKLVRLPNGQIVGWRAPSAIE